ncbi:MAG: hypothetical protein K6G18_06845 [Treponema sp.]|nr:hypothetical protein [Treponema sp.]
MNALILFYKERILSMAKPNCPVCDSNECVTFKKRETIGKGGSNGFGAGIMAGATLGSCVPLLGTVVGGILGGLAGGLAGGAIGSTLDTTIETWYCSKCDFEFDTKD